MASPIPASSPGDTERENANWITGLASLAAPARTSSKGENSSVAQTIDLLSRVQSCVKENNNCSLYTTLSKIRILAISLLRTAE